MAKYESWADYFEAYPQFESLFAQANRLQNLINTIIKYTPEKGSILEVGCGSAVACILLHDLGYKVTAIDNDKTIVDNAKKRIAQVGMNIETLCMDAVDLKFEDKSFDTVFSQGLLEHLSDEEIWQSLKEQKRVAGTVIVDVPTKRAKHGPGLYGNERFLSVKQWRVLISSAGLKIVDSYGRGMTVGAHLLPAVTWRLLDHILCPEVGFVCREEGKEGAVFLEKIAETYGRWRFIRSGNKPEQESTQA